MRPLEELRLRPEQRVDAERAAESRPAEWPSRRRRVLAPVLKALVPLLILAVAGAAVWRLYETVPVAERVAQERVPRLVETIEAAPAARGPLIEAWGEVAAARTLVIRPEVSGTVAWINERLTAGGLVRAGEELVRLDDRELGHALAEAEARIRMIEARIAMEEGQQERARRDLERLPGTLSEAQRSLVLRAPQKAELEAELAAAEAARDRARLDLLRTVIRAPFDALVLSEQVATGSMVAAGAEAATLVPADRFRVLVAVPPSALAWIEPEAGETVRLTQPGVWPAGSFREGTVERVAASLTASGRMAELIVAVEDPLATDPANAGKPALLLGSFVRAELAGRPVEGGVAIDRAHLREGDTVWVATPENRIELRRVTVGWRGSSEIYVTEGLAPGERVVTTPLAVVAPGMAVRVAGEASAEAGRAGSGG